MDSAKKIFGITAIWRFLALIPPTMLLLFGCSNDDNGTPTSGKDYITILPYIENALVKILGNDFEENDAIGLYVVQYNADNTTPGSIEAAYAANAEHIFRESSWLLPSGGKLAWPSLSRPVDLYAYHPYNSALDNLNPTQYTFAVSSDQSTKSGYQESDFLWSKSANVFPTRQPVELIFSHTLSKLKVNVRSDVDVIEEDVRNAVIRILNVIPEGNISLSDGSVTIPAGTNNGDIIAYRHATPDLGYHVSAEAILMPQQASQGNALITIDLPTNGTRYHYIPTVDIPLQQGTERSINITITELGLSVVVSEITDWRPTEIIEGEIGTPVNRVLDLGSLDWNASFIHHVYNEGIWIADVCREYLNGPGIDAQAIVVYMVDAQGSLDISKGFVAQVMSYSSTDYVYSPSTSNVHGGTVIWATDNSISSYVAGESPAVSRLLFRSNGAIEEAPDTYPVNLQTSPYQLTDIDANIYGLVKIGKQFWMKENLKVTHFNNGTALTAYDYLGTPAFSDIFGKLYTWDVMMDTNGIAPQGWRTFSYDDFNSLLQYIQPNSGSKLKANEYWSVLGDNNTDVTGFSAKGSGMRDYSGGNSNLFNYGYWWTTTVTGANPTVIRLYTNASYVETLTNIYPSYALSIRLIRE